MTKVNITPAAKKIAEAAEMFVEADTRTITIGDDERTQDTVVIGEEGTDFYIEYGVSRDGSLFYITAPDYVEDLPAHITSSIQLKSVVKYAVECCIEA